MRPNFFASSAVSAREKVRATSGNEASTPSAADSTAPPANERLPRWNWCDAMPQPAAPVSPGAIFFLALDDLLGDPVLGPHHDGQSGTKCASAAPR